MEIILDGTLLEVDFPFEEGGLIKRRWALALAKDSEGVWCMYCTTNPAPTKWGKPVRLGTLNDGRVSNLVAARIEKFDLESKRRTQKVRLTAPGVGEDVLRAVYSAARSGRYPAEVAQCVIENAKRVLEIMRARSAK